MEKSKNIVGDLASEGDDFVVNQSRMDRTELRQLLLSFESLKSDIPWKDMEDMGWIETGSRSLAQVVPYLLGSMASGQALYRKSTDEETLKIALWKSRVHMHATALLAENPSISFKIGSIDTEFLTELVNLSQDPKVILSLPELLMKKGILLIFERGLPGIKTDGLVYRTSNGIPVIAMTLRHARLDNFWFTLLHELSHVIKHYDLLDETIVEDLDSVSATKIEKQADRLAQNAIVPRYIWERCEARYTHSQSSVNNLAEQVGVHSALIAGMLRRELKDYSLFSSLVSAVNTREIIFGES